VLVSDYAHECWLAEQPSPPPGLAAFTCTAGSRANDAVYRVYALTTAAVSGGASAIRDRATLDLAIHLVDAPTPLLNVDAAQALTWAATRRMVESYATLLSGAGLCLGTVTFYDAPAWARERFGSSTSASDPFPCGNLPQLLATSQPGQRTLELFMLPKLQDAPDATGTVVGVDGAIPGPATINGTIASGAVVSGEDLGSGVCPAPGSGASVRPMSCGADLVAYIAAHETGHFLGLYHPTEGSGDAFDPLSDTPHCGCTHCGMTQDACNQSGIPGTRCTRPGDGCGGGGNLMFWIIGPASAGYLSPEQARIARSSPVVHAP
jgi:hypothetical protein